MEFAHFLAFWPANMCPYTIDWSNEATTDKSRDGILAVDRFTRRSYPYGKGDIGLARKHQPKPWFTKSFCCTWTFHETGHIQLLSPL